LSLGIVALVVLFNVCMNEYGLFGNVEGKSIKIYGDERTSKYLLSLNYIPVNFDGLLIGSSVSDNIDSKKLTHYKVYNASVNGATVAELKILVDNVLAKGELKCVVVSLYPILTGSNEKQTSRMVPSEYWGSLGSISTLDFYRRKILVSRGVIYDYFNDYGHYNYNLRKEGRDSMSLIRQKATGMKIDEPIAINDEACAELDTLLKTLRARGTKIFAFYHPVPLDCFVLYEKSYRSYQKKISAFFDSTDILWDYNTEEFLDFRKDYSNYCDEIHLSRKGIDYITRDINSRLSSRL
jgi:hypothetical protein